MKKLILISILSLFVTSYIFGDVTPKSDDNTVAVGSTFAHYIKVDDFINISAFQLSMVFDPTVLQLNSVSPTSAIMNGFAYNINNVQGWVVITWLNPSLLGVTIPNNSDFFKLSFKAIGGNGSTSPVAFSFTPSPIEFVDNNGNVLPSSKKNGTITLTGVPICPTGDLNLTTQTEVDAFPTNYPGCTVMPYNITIRESTAGNITNLNGLSQLQKIGGALWITQNTALTNLTGLQAITSIGQYVQIDNNSALTSLIGLNALSTIGAGLSIQNNNLLTDLTGLNALLHVGGHFWIQENDILTSLNGVNALTSIGDFVTIYDNPALASLTSLSALTSIGSRIQIAYNPSLTNLTGLNAVTSVNGFIWIQNNAALTSLTGIDNINPNTITDLRLQACGNLSICGVKSICDYLSVPTHTAIITGTALGCATRTEVNASCSITTPICPNGPITFTKQAEIDAFPTTYPGCKIMPHSITIRESTPGNITNLNGLIQLTEIQQSLEIQDNTALVNLAGLDALTTVGQHLLIRNNAHLQTLKGLFALNSITWSTTIDRNPILQNMNGLNALNTIGREFTIADNPALIDITALSLLKSIGGDFYIGRNMALPSLNGLNSVTSIAGRLEISSNNSLANITALSGLTAIPGSLGISFNPLLVNLTGLNAVKSIGGYLAIAQNATLQDITALGTVTYIGRAVEIGYNPVLTSLAGLGGITAINGDLLLSYNVTLVNISSLGSIISIAGDLGLQGNASLVNFTGLNNLTKIGGSLLIIDNAQLSDLSSFNNLTVLGGGILYLDNNPALTSLTGLNNIDPLNITNLKIQNSGTLSYCGVKSICDYLSIATNSATISGNAVGCATRAEVSNSCCTIPSTPSVSDIAMTSAKVSWSAVQGSQGYTLEYKLNTASTWTVVSGLAATATSYIITGLTANKSYNVRLKSVCSATASSGYATVNFSTPCTQVLTTAPGSRCGTGNVLLSATTMSGSTLRWYNAPTGGTSLPGGTTFNTGSISQTTTFYVEATTNTCASARMPVVATVNAIPSVLSVTPASVCGPAPAVVTLGAMGSSGSTLNWYSALSGGVSLVTGTTFSPTITTTKNFYVSATNGFCTSSPRQLVKATLNPTPTVTNPLAGSRCGVGSVLLKATTGGVGNVLKWYDMPTGGTSLFTGSMFNTPSINITTAYYVEATNTTTNCTSARIPIIATIKDVPSVLTTIPNTRCGSGGVQLGATGSAGSILKWYNVATGGTGSAGLSGGTLYNTPSIAASATTVVKVYYVEASSNSCASPRSPVTATINPVPALPSAVNVSRCDEGTLTLTANSALGNSLKWFITPSGGASVSTGSSFTTPPINSTTIYYVESNNGYCSSTNRRAVTASVIAAILSVTPGNSQNPGSVTLSATATTGSTIKWYSSATGGIALWTGGTYITPSINASVTYYVEAKRLTCTTARIPVLAKIGLFPNPLDLKESISDNGFDVEKTKTHTHFTVSPNPAYDFVKIDISTSNNSNARIIIKDVLGKIVYQQKVSGQETHTWQTNNLAKGMYFISLHVDNALYTERVILK